MILGETFDAIMQMGGGLFFLLLGFRVIGKKPGIDLKADRWHERFGRATQILGILTLGLGVTTMMRKPPSGAPLQNSPPAWHHYTSPRANFVVDFPGEPLEETTAPDTGFGRVEMHKTFVKVGELDAFTVVDFELPSDYPDRTVDAILDHLRTSFAEGISAKELNERRVERDGISGRDATFTSAKGYGIRMLTFACEHMVWKIATAVQSNATAEQIASRFLDSFRPIRK